MSFVARENSSNAKTADSALRQAYDADGFVVLRSLFRADEMAALAHEADALWNRHDLIDKQNLRCRFQSHYQSDDCLFETFDPVIDIAPLSRGIAFDPRILDVLRVLYGEEPKLFKDKLIFKPPGAKGYGLHQDYIAWPRFPRSFLTVLVPIDRAHAGNGCTEVFPGRHTCGCLSPEDGAYHELPLDGFEESRGVKLELEPGDIAIFGGFTPHRSGPNEAPTARRQLYLSYNASSDGGDLRAIHYEDFHAYLRMRYAEHGYTEMYFE